MLLKIGGLSAMHLNYNLHRHSPITAICKKNNRLGQRSVTLKCIPTLINHAYCPKDITIGLHSVLNDRVKKVSPAYI